MTDQLALNTIEQIHISVTDIDESVTFYRDVLGMKFLFQVPGRDKAFFDCGGVRLYLGIPERPEFKSTAIIYYRVDDIQQVWKSWMGKGVNAVSKPHMISRMEDHKLWMGFSTTLATTWQPS
ncbi:MAG: VOC family protein [SAR202 cluster bacterium]|nr:VOC family protein [SAR202 cluster bacterium]